MKTAEEYLKIWQGEESLITKDIAVISMKEYAKQVAEQALKDAAQRIIANEMQALSIKQSILTTTILTP